MRTYSKGFNTKPVVFILVLALVLGLFNAGTLPAIESYAAPTDVINFPDAKLLTALKAAGIDKNSDGVITQGEMAAKTGYLNIDEKGITTLEGIQYATRISYLLFSKNQIKDISPLATMTNLIEITGYSNQISDITPVASLINLTELNFINNQISDLSPVQSVTNLKKLYLEKNQIDDISPLANLKPYTIDLDYNKLDLSPNSPAMQIMNHLIISGCSIKFFPQNTGQTVTTYAGIEKTVFNEYISLEGHLIEGAIVRVYLRYYGEKVFKGTEYEYISPSSGALMKESTIAIGTFPNVDFGGFVGYFMMPASNVTVTAIFEDPLPPTYTAIAQQAIGGTLTVSPSAVALGDWVDIMVQADTGKRLVENSLVYEYIATSPEIVTVPISSSGFTMPGYNVTVSAMFEDAPSTQAGITYTAIVQQSTGGMISVNPTAAAAGNWINVTTQPNAGKRILAGSLAYKYIASPSGAEATASIASTGFTMPGSNVTISAIFENIPVSLTAGSITIEVSPAPKSPYSVYVYNSALNLYRWKDVGGSSNGGVTIGSSIAAIIPTSVAIDNLPLDRDYQVSIYMGEEESYYTKQQTVQLNSSDVTQAFAIPVMFSISGSLTLTNGSAPAEYTYVTARDTSTGQEFYGYTNIAGEYKIRGLSAATYNVSYSNWNSKYVGTLTQSAIITNQDVTGIDLVLIKGAGLRGTVTNNNIGPFKAKISLWKKDASQSYQYATSAYSGSTGFNMEGIIKEQGDYKLQLDYIQNRDGTNPAYVSNPTEFTVTAGDIVSGIIGQNITYSDPSRPTQALSGQGNQVLTDLKTVYNGNHVNLKVSFKNNGNTTVSPIFSIVLPNGLSFSNASQATYTAINLKPGQNGQHNAVIRIDNPLHDTAKIQVKVQVGSGSAFDFGDAGLIVSRVTLNGPGAVKPDETFKVYGEATSGSTIAIKNIDSNQIYAAVTPTGRFYSAAIGPLPEGNYRFVAEATVNGVTSTSDILDVESKERQIAIKSVTINSNGMTDLPMNKIIGVRGFTAWVDSAMRGRDINLGVEFENAGDIASVRYNFADLTFGGIKGNTFYDANLTGWYGAGLKTITATVTTVDGRILNFIIAEATILIDPSGIVTDKSTGRPVSGVEMICYILNGVIWEKWDAELYGQINPQKTDNDGKYGWMVPAGIYKVTATKAGYLPYDTMNDPKFSTNGNSTIIIPPPREDVNIELIPIGDNSSTSDEEDIGPNQNTNKDAVLKPTDDRIDQIKDIRGHWGSVAISYVISNKIMSGTSSTEFSPNTNMTRAMMVAVFANLQGIPFDAQAKSGFNDVEVGSWYGSAVTWAAKNKLVSGDGKGNFAAERKITREEMAVMLYQYAKMIGKDISAKEELSKFKDGQETSDWAKEAMIWAVSNGLFQGKENNTLDPKGKATRAEIATIIYKFSVDL